MNRAGLIVLLGVAGLSLAGCSNTMRNYLEKDAPTETLAVRQDLTMPPDLRLPPPGTTAPAPDPGAAAAAAAMPAQTASLSTPPSTAPVYKPQSTSKAAPTTTAPATTAAVTTPEATGPDAVYVNAGISLYNPDGTKKTKQQLNNELQAYYTAQKKAKNPSYGTVFNMGNIFKDE